ncbi:MAG: glycerophosphodiester phosphodiesterase family protein, partial [Gemmatimonadota bacterium]
MRSLYTALLGLTAALTVAACSDTPTQPLDGPTGASVSPDPVARPIYSTVQDLLSAAGGPVAIAHRGMGENLGEDPTRPIENTIEALRLGFESGAAVVEADLQMTADGEIVVWHDDFLEDYTCINTLTRDQLAERAPWIDSFQALLQLARRHNAQNPDRLSGLVTVDLKPASPLCDPQDVTG